MSLSFSLLKPPLPPSSKFSSLSSSFLHGSNFSHLTTKLSTLSLSSQPTRTSSSTFPVIKAMKSMQGRVVCATNNKTVSVEVTRLAPHPKYKRRVKKKKKYQAHDPDNKFKVGDWVQLEKCRPISKTKTFLAIVPDVVKNAPKAVEKVPVELGLPLESEQSQEKKVQ
uniref:Small ribosomal subunit protein uS17c n=2 Tax=Opuntia streptacantha TaxID=393608 RepID=A0A7C8ZHD2_OPUST